MQNGSDERLPRTPLLSLGSHHRNEESYSQETISHYQSTNYADGLSFQRGKRDMVQRSVLVSLIRQRHVFKRHRHFTFQMNLFSSFDHIRFNR